MTSDPMFPVERLPAPLMEWNAGMTSDPMSSAVNVSLAVDGNRRSPRREDGAASVLARLRRALEQPARKLGDAGTAVGRGQKINIRV